MTQHLVALHGGLSARDRREAVEQLAGSRRTRRGWSSPPAGTSGEGFDDPRLDTLILALPVAWKGTVVQYTGRLHRLQAGKSEVRIHDYRDGNVPVLDRMLDKRLRAYRAMGYVAEAANLGRSDCAGRVAPYEPGA